MTPPSPTLPADDDDSSGRATFTFFVAVVLGPIAGWMVGSGGIAQLSPTNFRPLLAARVVLGGLVPLAAAIVALRRLAGRPSLRLKILVVAGAALATLSARGALLDLVAGPVAHEGTVTAVQVPHMTREGQAIEFGATFSDGRKLDCRSTVADDLKPGDRVRYLSLDHLDRMLVAEGRHHRAEAGLAARARTPALVMLAVLWAAALGLWLPSRRASAEGRAELAGARRFVLLVGAGLVALVASVASFTVLARW